MTTRYEETLQREGQSSDLRAKRRALVKHGKASWWTPLRKVGAAIKAAKLP